MRARSKGRLLLGLAAIGLSACGARSVLFATEEGDAGVQHDAGAWVGFSDSAEPAPTPSAVGGSPDGATAGPMPADDVAPPTSTACTRVGAGGGGGAEDCLSTFGETCGGTNYQVSCSCPRGSCVCFGLSTTVVSFTGCPSCPGLGSSFTTDDILALCGFPH